MGSFDIAGDRTWDMAAPKFSVVIPLHNRAEAIETCVQSVLNQTCQDFEIVVVDDGSTDGGAEVVEAIGDPRVRCLRQVNRGSNAARNRGIDAARGRFVALLDSDDQFFPRHLERAAAILDTAPEAMVFARVVVDRGDGRYFMKPPRGPRPGEEICEYLFCDRGFTQTSTIVLSAETARRVRFLEWLKCSQDSDFAVRLAAAGVPFRIVEEPGAVWSDHYDPRRISSVARHETPLRWCREYRGLMTERAYHAFRGWVIAKHLARAGRRREALRLYATAVRHGCWKPALALRILAQLTTNEGGYRRVANLLMPKRESRRGEQI